MTDAPPRPRTRADCLEGGCNAARPCPWVSCKWHLLPEWSAKVHRGLKLSTLLSDTRILVDGRTYPLRDKRIADIAVAVLMSLPDTCALDVADRGDQTLSEIGEIIGVTRERVRQIESKALEKKRAWAEAHGITAADYDLDELERLRGARDSMLPEAHAFFPSNPDSFRQQVRVAESKFVPEIARTLRPVAFANARRSKRTAKPTPAAKPARPEESIMPDTPLELAARIQRIKELVAELDEHRRALAADPTMADIVKFIAEAPALSPAPEATIAEAPSPKHPKKQGPANEKKDPRFQQKGEKSARELMLQLFRENPKRTFTRNECAELAGIPVGTASGYLTTLKAQGIVEPGDTRGRWRAVVR